MEYVIYDNLDYDAYKETARENLEANGNANPTEEELSSEVDFLMQNDWQYKSVNVTPIVCRKKGAKNAHKKTNHPLYQQVLRTLQGQEKACKRA